MPIDDFGFTNTVWVFSGRRGIHAWVCDPKARAMKHDARASLVDYLSLIIVFYSIYVIFRMIFKGGDKSESKTISLSTPLHPHIR